MTIEELITFNQNGLVTASYVQIREALTAKYKEIYGTDIDVSTASADGQYVSSLSLVIYNMLESIKKMYTSLDPNVANGKFLDIICALSNITRKGPTKSYASLLVTNNGNTDYTSTSITFIDRANITWKASNSDGTPITITAGSSVTLIATCDLFGPIAAEGSGEADTPGWIYQTLDNNSLTVIQENDAVIGTYEEGDSELRSRRAKSTGQDAITTLDGLTGSLLDIDGIRDVKIYNNPTSSTVNVRGDLNVKPHSVLISIRKDDGIDVEDSLVGSTIYENMTPGIGTDFLPASGVGNKVYNYPTISALQQPVYWRYARPIHPTINVILEINDSFDTQDEYKIIRDYLFDLLNNKAIGESLNPNNLKWEVQCADPLSKGLPTYSVTSVSINNSTEVYQNADDDYYQYTSCTVTQTGTAYQISLS